MLPPDKHVAVDLVRYLRTVSGDIETGAEMAEFVEVWLTHRLNFKDLDDYVKPLEAEPKGYEPPF